MADSVNKSFFDALLDAKAAKWSAGVAFDRSNPLPLDQWSVFKDKAAAEAYLTNAKAYPGQVIAYAEADVKEGETLVKAGGMVACVLSSNAAGTGLELKQIGVIPTGTGAINVTEDGEISVNVDDSTIKIVDGKLVAVIPEIPEFEDTDTTYSVKDGEKVLKLEGTEFSTELGLKHENGKISLTGVNGQVIAEFSDAEFVADGVLEDVSYNEETKDLVFTWNIVIGKDEDGKDIYKTDTVNIADLVDVNTDTTYTIGTEDSEKKVKVTLTPSEGEAQEVEVNAYNTTTMDDMLYNGKYTKKTKNDDGTTTEEEVVSNIVSNKEKARLISTEEIAKLSALVLGEDGSVGVSGTISAENVTGLADAITSQVTGANALNIAQGAQVNVIEEIKVNGEKVSPTNKSVDITVPTDVKDLADSDKKYVTNVRMREASEGYAPALQVNKTGSEAVIDDSALQATIKGLSDTAVQSGEFAGKAMTKDGTKLSISQADARDALGLKSAAYKDESTFAPAGDYKTKQTVKSGTLTGAQVVGSWTQDENGEVAVTPRNLTPADIGAQPAGNYQEAGDYKVKQTPVADPTATKYDGSVLSYIETLSQNENGEISATKRSFDMAAYIEKVIGDSTNIMNFRGVVTPSEAGFAADVAVITSPQNGDVILYGEYEYIYNGTKWEQFGDATGAIATAKAYTDAEIAKIHSVDNDTIKLNDNKAYVAKVSTDVLVQGTQELVLCGGNAFGFGSNS